VSVESCKRESADILRRLRNGDLSVQESIALLDSAMVAALRKIKPDEIASLKQLMLENDKIVRRESHKLSS